MRNWLAPWIQSISNHLWLSAATCYGGVQLLCEKWKSVLDHVSNRHKWSGNTLFHPHRCIPSSEAKQICWLRPGTPAHLALEEVVLNAKLLKDLAKLTDFCHTGTLDDAKVLFKMGTFFVQGYGCQNTTCHSGQ